MLCNFYPKVSSIIEKNGDVRTNITFPEYRLRGLSATCPTYTDIKIQIKNKTVLITGGSGGLGRSLAMAYAKQGGRIINLSRNIEKMKEFNTYLDERSLLLGIRLSLNEIKRVQLSLATNRF